MGFMSRLQYLHLHIYTIYIYRVPLSPLMVTLKTKKKHGLSWEKIPIYFDGNFPSYGSYKRL